MVNEQDLQGRLRAVMRRVFQRDVGDGVVTVREIEEWDSMSHINLVIELEMEFDLQIGPDDIAALYSDSKTVLDYIAGKVG